MRVTNSAIREPHNRTLPSDLDDVVSAWLADLAERVHPLPDLQVSYQVRDRGTVLAERASTHQHYAASTMKLPLVLAAYRRRDAGTLDLDSMLTVHNRFTSRAGGDFGVEESEDSDPQVWAAMGTEVSLRWLCRRSIIRSSNLATNLVLEAVGLAAVTETIEVCGADGIRFARGIGDFAAQSLGVGNRVTVAGLNTLLLALADGTAAEPGTCAEVLQVLADNEIDTDVRGGLPAGVWVAHKNGWVSDAVLDAALVRPAAGGDRSGEFALSAAVSGRLDNEHPHRLIQSLASTVWRARTGNSDLTDSRPGVPAGVGDA